MVRALPLSRGERRPSGVTLLEILVAVAVLAVGLSTIFQIFPMGFAASAKSSAQTTAYELAARKMEDVRNNHLFGGPPSDPDLYWGNRNAPNPDGGAFVEVNTDGNFRAFSADQIPERNFFYRVHCIPVVDPPKPRTAVADLQPSKYLEYPHILDPESSDAWETQWRGFASMYRVTVTVRGPLKIVAEAQDAQWDNSLAQKGAVEAKLVTYLANKKLGDALLAVDPNCTIETNQNPDYGSTQSSKPVRMGYFVDNDGNGTLDANPADGADFIHIVGLDGGHPFPENFTVLNGLTSTEVLDTGPNVVLPGGIPLAVAREDKLSSAYVTKASQMRGAGLNRTGMDNVLIIWRIPNTNPPRFIAESNKIVAIHPPGTLNTGYSGTNSLWRLDLLNPLIASDGDYSSPERHGSGDSSSGFLSQLADGFFDEDETNLKKPEPDNQGFAYPAWTGNPPPQYCTRVRFLMRLEKWPR